MLEPIYAIGYARLSDPKQTLGGGGDNQVDAIKKYCKDEGLVLYNDKVYTEVFSGAKSLDDRPVYNELLKIIQKEKGKIKFFVIKKIDRSTRGGSSEYQKMKLTLRLLGVGLRDTERVIQPSFNRLSHRGVGYSWSNTSPSDLAEIILSELASEGRKGILTQTVDTSVNRIETGFKLRSSNYGFQNKQIVDTDGQLKYIQVPFEPEASCIRELFRLSVETSLTDKEIANKLSLEGHRTRGKNKWNSQRTAIIGYDKGKEISYKNISRWKQNLIYCGILQEEWGEFEKKFILIKTKYDGLVSVETFNRANKGKIFVKFEDVNTIKILYNQQTDRTIKRRQKFNPDYIFKNIILCSICKKTLKASASKSKSGNMFPLIIVVEITIMSDILNKNLKIML